MSKTYNFIIVGFCLLNGDSNFFLGVNDRTVVENTVFQDNKSLYTLPQVK